MCAAIVRVCGGVRSGEVRLAEIGRCEVRPDERALTQVRGVKVGATPLDLGANRKRRGETRRGKDERESVAWATDRGGGRWGVGWVGGGGANFVERAAKELSGGEVSR